MLLLPILLMAAMPAAAQESSADVKVARALYRAGNVAGAVARLEPAANKGDSEAAYLMGEVYRNGSQAYPMDMAKAAVWYRKGGELGDLSSMFQLGMQLLYGNGVDKDEAQAFTWFEKAARAGHTRAAYFAGDALMNGTGTAKDTARGIPYLRQAAEDGYRLAVVDYGYALDTGNGVAEDDAAAFEWYRKGGELGSGTGAFNTGVFYRDGLGGAPRNRAAAFYWFLRSAMADTPHGNAEGEIAALREAGGLVSPEGKALHDQAEQLVLHASTEAELRANKPKAFALHQQAAQLGHLPSINYMMTAYRERGWGTEPDLPTARQWAQISAEMDDREGQRVLAAMMLGGVGGPRNTQGARFWYEKSAMQGNAQAMMALAKIYDGDSGLPPNEALAIYWYKQAYAKNWFGAEQVLLQRGVLQPDPVSAAFIQRIESQGPDRSSSTSFTVDVAQYCKYGGSRCTALSIEARNFERAQNSAAESANMARLWNVYSSPGESDAKWRERSECMQRKTESIQRHTYGQQDWYYSGACY
jgi:hypothetical protein